MQFLLSYVCAVIVYELPSRTDFQQNMCYILCAEYLLAACTEVTSVTWSSLFDVFFFLFRMYVVCCLGFKLKLVDMYVYTDIHSFVSGFLMHIL